MVVIFGAQTKPGWLRQIKVLVWDLDKTLYKDDPKLQEELRNSIYWQVAEKKRWSFEKAKEEFIKRHQKSKASTKVLYSLGLDGIEIFDKVFSAINWSRYLKKDEKLKQVFSALKNFNHIIVSNNKKRFIILKLKLLGVDSKIFSHLFCLHSLGIYKPGLKAFKIVLEKTPLPAFCHLSIGDKESTDIIPAQKVGMRTCLVWGKSAIADVSLPTVYDVVKLFQ